MLAMLTWSSSVPCRRSSRGSSAEEQLAVADDGIAAQPDSAAANHHPGLLRAATPHDPVGIGQDQPLEQRFVVRRSRDMAGIARGPRGQPDQVVANPCHLAGRGRIDPAIPQAR